jgi:hypothetical protein
MRQSYDLPHDDGSRRSHRCPSLPPQDGVDAQICTGIHTGASTVSAVDRHTHVVGTSLPVQPTGEHDATGGPSDTFLSPPCALCEHGGVSPRARPHDRSQGLMAPSPMSFGVSTPSHSPHHFVPFVSMGGGMYSVGWSFTAANRGD